MTVISYSDCIHPHPLVYVEGGGGDLLLWLQVLVCWRMATAISDLLTWPLWSKLTSQYKYIATEMLLLQLLILNWQTLVVSLHGKCFEWHASGFILIAYFRLNLGLSYLKLRWGLLLSWFIRKIFRYRLMFPRRCGTQLTVSFRDVNLPFYL